MKALIVTALLATLDGGEDVPLLVLDEDVLLEVERMEQGDPFPFDGGGVAMDWATARYYANVDRICGGPWVGQEDAGVRCFSGLGPSSPLEDYSVSGTGPLLLVGGLGVLGGMALLAWIYNALGWATYPWTPRPGPP